ncbi:MAG TPA: hypothetical protein VI911_04260 [Patescibacteria group bacterium]|nr:hypothetical protein [Patescibacteria group bacterium]
MTEPTNTAPFITPIDRMRWLTRLNAAAAAHPLAQQSGASIRYELLPPAEPAGPPAGVLSVGVLALAPSVKIEHPIPVSDFDLLVTRTAELDDHRLGFFVEPLIVRATVATTYAVLESVLRAADEFNVLHDLLALVQLMLDADGKPPPAAEVVRARGPLELPGANNRAARRRR